MLCDDKHTAIAKLNEALESIPRAQDAKSEVFHLWRRKTAAALKSIFGDDSDSEINERFGRIPFESHSIRRSSISDLRRGLDTAAAENDHRKREAFETGCMQAEKMLRELFAILRAEPEDSFRLQPPGLRPEPRVATPFKPLDTELPTPPTIHVAGNFYSTVQVNSPGASQALSITVNPVVAQAVLTIQQALNESDDLDAHDKEDIKHELDRISEIAKREMTEKTKENINSKLTTLEKMLSVATKLSQIAGPAILAIRQYYKIRS